MSLRLRWISIIPRTNQAGIYNYQLKSKANKKGSVCYHFSSDAKIFWRSCDSVISPICKIYRFKNPRWPTKYQEIYACIVKMRQSVKSNVNPCLSWDLVESQSFREAKQASWHHHMNLNGIDAGFEAGQLTLSARLGGDGGGSAGD